MSEAGSRVAYLLLGCLLVGLSRSKAVDNVITAIDAFTGPQALAPGGFALVGRLPSQVRPWFGAQLEMFSTNCIINECADAGIEELGLIIRTQRGGDINLTRPVFVTREWVDMFMHTDEGRIPAMEWRYVV